MRFLFTLLLVLASARSNIDLGTHSFVDISGWPHSGTSVVHEIFKHIPQFSTFFDACDKFEKECKRFNYEGQWLLEETVAKSYRPGVYCELFEINSPSFPIRFLSQWGKVWNISRPYLIQKSPADLLKMPFLRSIFRPALDQKYVVVIKHPATLFQSLPRRTSWRMFAESDDKTLRIEKPNGRADVYSIEDAVDHFAAMMLSDQLDHAPSVHRKRKYHDVDLHYASQSGYDANNFNSSIGCVRSSGKGLGWLSSMEHFLRYLHENKDWAKSHLRIVRFEDFIDNGNSVCIALVKFLSNGFLSDSDDIIHFQQVCDKLFLPLDAYVSTSPWTKTTHALWDLLMPKPESKKTEIKCKDSVIFDEDLFNAMEENSFASSIGADGSSVTPTMRMNGLTVRRRLNLHQYKKNQTPSAHFFEPLTTFASCVKRNRFFDSAFSRMNEANRTTLLRIEKRMKPFGYSIRRGKHYPYRCEASVFSDYELMQYTDVVVEK